MKETRQGSVRGTRCSPLNENNLRAEFRRGLRCEEPPTVTHSTDVDRRSGDAFTCTGCTHRLAESVIRQDAPAFAHTAELDACARETVSSTSRTLHSSVEPAGPFEPAALLEGVAQLGLHDRPLVGAPARLQEHADQPLDAEPRVPERALSATVAVLTIMSATPSVPSSARSGTAGWTTHERENDPDGAAA